uniref:proteasome endopeptidase complex n=1 Tax=Panagrellus redivivus TaxID=6233 RepID=A0A7E4ZWE6_PANRE
MDFSDFQPEPRKAIPAIGYYPGEPISTGTTLIACEYDGGVVVGTDSRTSSGAFVASRVTDKITPITDFLSVCRSGSAADTQCVADIVKYYLEYYSISEGDPITVYRSSQIFRQFLYRYRDSMTASVIVAGYDNVKGGQIYSLPLGGFVTRQHFTASGSGSGFVHGFLDSQWKPNMTHEEVKNLVRQAVFLATFRDGSSGGVIRLASINKNGTQRELIRPDAGEGFPKVFEPKVYSTLPPHLGQ